MSNRSAVSCVVPAGARLGECPLWSTVEQVLYWIDIDGRAVHRYDPSSGQDETRSIATRPGSIGLTAQPGVLLMGTENLIAFFDWATGRLRTWLETEPPNPDIRLNDGRADPVGRYWTGSMYDPVSENRFAGSLYRIETDGTSEAIRRRIGVANGIAFSPGGGTMYFADTLRDTVWAYDYDLDDGVATNERVFVDFTDLPGRPDGACVDEAGCYWVACVNGWAVARVTPEGGIDRIVELPVEKPTMPAFGGSDLGTLFITSIGDGDGAEAGGLFAFQPGVGGVREPLFGGLPPSDASGAGS